MRPVAPEFEISQAFASMPTAGVVPDYNRPGTVNYYVALYGDYQPFGHAGCDIATPVGTEVHAIHAGTVIWVGWDTQLPGGPNDWYDRWFFYQAFGGRLLLVQTVYGHIHAYAHLSAWKVKVGDVVREGQLIALTGDSAAGVDHGVAPHLHVEKIVNFNYLTGGGLIYGRTDPAPDFGGYKPLSTQSAPLAKESEMPTSKTVASTFTKRHRLPKGKAYTLSVKDDGASANFAVCGVGHYLISLNVEGQGLLPGEVVNAQFFITRNGKTSGYFEKDIDGTKDGSFNKEITFNRKVESGSVIIARLTSKHTENAYCTGFGADVTAWS